MATVFAFGNCLRRNGPNATVALVPVPSSAKTFLPVSSAGSADTPTIVEMEPFSTLYIDALPMASMPSAITWTPLVLSICWPQVVPCASEVTMKHSASLTGWPWMPPSDELMYLTVASAALVASGKVWLGGPPCMFTQPMVTGARLLSAGPALPPVNCTKSVTPPVAPLPVLVAGDEEEEVAGVLAAALVGVVFAGVELELDVELVLHAAAPITRTAPTAATRHLEPTPIRR